MLEDANSRWRFLAILVFIATLLYLVYDHYRPGGSLLFAPVMEEQAVARYLTGGAESVSGDSGFNIPPAALRVGAFNYLDQDGNNILTPAEGAPPGINNYVSDIYRNNDANGDGSVTREEYHGI